MKTHNLDIKKKYEKALSNFVEKVKKDIFFEPIVKWLREEGKIRGVSEINDFVKRKYNISNDGNELTDTYNWLVGKGVLIKASESIKLLDKSKVLFEEAAYSYNFSNDM